MKIDCHMHITPPCIKDGTMIIGEEESYFHWLSSSSQNRFATGEEVIEILDTTGFEKGIVFGFAFKSPVLCRYVNDYTMAMVAKYPNRLIGFMVVSPEDPEMSKEIERCVAGGLVGIGELFPEGQGWDLIHAHTLYPLKVLCSKYRLPVLLHTNEPVGHTYIGKTQTPLKSVEDFILNHGDTPIILAHLGGGLMFYEAMKEVKQHFKHVYYDTAAAIFLYEPMVYQIAQHLDIIDKILFGSDYPLVSPARYMKSLSESGLGEGALAHILGDNVKPLFYTKS